MTTTYFIKQNRQNYENFKVLYLAAKKWLRLFNIVMITLFIKIVGKFL